MKIIKVIIIILLIIIASIPTIVLDYKYNSIFSNPDFYYIISSIIVGSIYGTKIGELLLRFNSWFNSKFK